MSLRIIKLCAENFKRLRAVEIKPDGSVVIVRGRNGQGKTSVLDAISAALGGQDLCPRQPIRNGEDHAEVFIDIGDYRITRTFTPKDSYLTVKDKNGAKVANPQKLLDGLIGMIAFDPLEFARMKPEAQAKQLAVITGLDFGVLDKERKVAFEERTAINREAKSLEVKVAEAEKPVAGLNAAEYGEEVSVADLSREHKAAVEAAGKVSAAMADLDRLEMTLRQQERERDQKRAEIERLTRELAALEKNISTGWECHKEDGEAIQQQQAALPDVDTIMQRFQSADAHNTTVRAFSTLARCVAELAEVSDAAAALTARLDAIDAEKLALVRAAEERLPVTGLTFDEAGVRYKDVIFEECCDSEKLKVSTALAISLNPKLRILRITDGSLLDANSLAVLEKIAEQNDFQIWIEVVSDAKDGVGVLIENGEVVS